MQHPEPQHRSAAENADDDLAFLKPAASERIVEEPGPLIGDSAVFLGPGFSDPELARKFRNSPKSARVVSHRLRSVVLDVRTKLLLNDGLPFAPSRYMVSDADWEGCRVAGSARLDHYGRRTVLGVNRPWKNYFHWLTQCLPAIHEGWVETAGRAALLTHALQPVQRRSLELLGIAFEAELEIEPEAQYALSDVGYCTFLSGATAFTPSLAAAALYRKLADAVAEPESSPQRLLYVSRRDSKNRILANEAALAHRLAAKGIEVVEPGTLSLDEQIRLFRTARLVIGPHGAGLANIAFCRAGTAVYELLPSHYLNQCFAKLAQSLQLDYWADLFDPVGAAGQTHHQQSWAVDLDSVERHVDDILRHYGL